MRSSVFFILSLSATVWGQNPTEIRLESFNSDPHWEESNNRTPVVPITVTQDFGFSNTNHAGGNSTGEIGGRFWRSFTPAYYAKEIGPLSLEDPFSFSGQFRVTNLGGSSAVIAGFFNHETLGWRPLNWFGFWLDDGREVRIEHNTRLNQAGSVRLPGNPTLVIGNVYRWNYSYDPSGGGGRGQIHFALEGPEFEEPLEAALLLPAEQREGGATFTRFGVMALQRSGDHLDAYFDDLVFNGEVESFDDDPEWEGDGNRVTFQDDDLALVNDFGYSTTCYAGGDGKGEVGGRLWRTQENNSAAAGAYGDESIGMLSLENTLSASGTVAMLSGSPDSSALLGWYNSQGRGWPPTNFIGILIEGPSDVGHYFRPFYGTAEQGVYQDGKPGPLLQPLDGPHHWSFDYVPDSAGGGGTLTVHLDGQSVTRALDPAHRAIGATFDRFGLFTMEWGGDQTTLYFDYLEYTVEQGTGPASGDLNQNGDVDGKDLLLMLEGEKE